MYQAKKNESKESKRTEARKKAIYELNRGKRWSAQVNKSLILRQYCPYDSTTPAQIKLLFNSIIKNRVSDFGVVKLSHLFASHSNSSCDLPDFRQQDLQYDWKRLLFQENEPFSSSGEVDNESFIVSRSTLLRFCTHISLLQFSVIFGRDKISSALLRAGANPCLYPLRLENDIPSCKVHTSSLACASLVENINPSYLIWLLNLKRRLTESLLETMAARTRNCTDNTDFISCKRCFARPVELDSLGAEGSVASDANSGTLLGFALLLPCGDVLCNDCFWETMPCPRPKLQLHPSLGGEIFDQSDIERLYCNDHFCPMCDAKIMPREDRGEKEDYSSTASASASSSAPRYFLSYPSENCRSLSLQRYLSLSKDLIDVGRVHNVSVPSAASAVSSVSAVSVPISITAKNPQFAALPPASQATHFIGTTQAQRDAELFKAVAASDLYRVAALVQAGIDINARNDYGQTAMFIALLRDDSVMVRVLMRAGGDCMLQDAAGVDLLSLARHRHNTEVAELLIDAGLSQKENEKNSFVDLLPEELRDMIEPRETEPRETEPRNIEPREIEPRETESRETEPRETEPREIEPREIEMVTREIQRLGLGLSPSTDYGKVKILISHDMKLSCSTAGISATIDRCVSDSSVDYLQRLFHSLPIAPATKPSCSDRAYFYDTFSSVTGSIERAIRLSLLHGHSSLVGGSDKEKDVVVFPKMKFLFYRHAGGKLEPHVDLSKTDDLTGLSSTHTFILYLSSCSSGGETALLSSVKWKPRASSQVESAVIESEAETEPGRILAVVKPEAGRLFIFPHNFPHCGLEVVDVPKLLLRGEVYISNSMTISSTT